MSEGRARLEWEQTAALVAMVHNRAFGATEAAHPDDFNPFTEIDAARRAADDVAPQEVAANWAFVKSLVDGNRFR